MELPEDAPNSSFCIQLTPESMLRFCREVERETDSTGITTITNYAGADVCTGTYDAIFYYRNKECPQEMARNWIL